MSPIRDVLKLEDTKDLWSEYQDRSEVVNQMTGKHWVSMIKSEQEKFILRIEELGGNVADADVAWDRS